MFCLALPVLPCFWHECFRNDTFCELLRDACRPTTNHAIAAPIAAASYLWDSSDYFLKVGAYSSYFSAPVLTCCLGVMPLLTFLGAAYVQGDREPLRSGPRRH